MQFRCANKKVPKEKLIPFAEEQWYKTLTARPTPMCQLDESALVAESMSMLWAPKNPRHTPIYSYKGKAYNMINAIDVKVGGEMTVRILPDGKLHWLEQLRDYFHHPTEESSAAYMLARTCVNTPIPTKLKTALTPTREEISLLLSEESIAFSGGLGHLSRSTCASASGSQAGGSGARGGVGREKVVVEPSDERQTEKRSEVRVEPEAGSGKRSSSKSYLDYVVVSDSICGLDVGSKHGVDEAGEDQATISQILDRKRKNLDEAKCKLDTEASLQVSEKKWRLMRQAEGLHPQRVKLIYRF
ncbi:hypothetical protein HanXRQr2_Chr16g0739861 [Helianthus annuus]|uniref:Uncharacterized protein n=1 Tax=Helianthus annuus TaxID=4232 RepID=A0A9K3DS29_HELAN|nr:hypothetical protein HanXRQr2_Chr16g0739861 [Helianthus annuus]KAJ0437621.1 hypothetical protein HanHA300_Chr16g0604271 [Helianthus annuus]KAJ0459869.1 hypothetical protein HanHA89_Chr16g0653951 [Helianthus annuus]